MMGARMRSAIGAIVFDLQEERALGAPHIIEHVGNKITSNGDESVCAAVREEDAALAR